LFETSRLRAFVLAGAPACAKSYAVDYRAGSDRGSPKRRLTIGKHGSLWTPGPIESKQGDCLLKSPLAVGDLITLYLTEGVSHKKISTPKARSRTR